jgi:hypothetical protein
VTDYDPQIGAILDRLVPPFAAEPNGWQELLRAAGIQPRRRLRWLSGWAARRRPHKVLVLAAALVTTVVVAIPALAVSKGWWFLHSGAPKPESDVAVVTSGRAAGIDWTMTAYVSADKGVCFGLTPNVGRGDMGSMSCGSDLRGEPNPGAGDRRGQHWVGYVYFSLGLYKFPNFVFGPVAQGVEQVDLVLSNGQVIQADTLQGPDELGAPLDFYAVPVPSRVPLNSLIARDRFGNVLERRACPHCGELPRSGQSDHKAKP